MTVKTYTRSFAGGEISELLFGRLDLVKFQTGLAECLNFRVTPQGPVENRAGFAYVNKAKYDDKKAYLIPFSYNTEQTFAVEFGDFYVRFHTQGATLLETGLSITAISQANPGVLTYTGTDPANGEWMYLAGIGGMTPLNGRYVVVTNVNAGANTFELYDLFGDSIDTSAYPAWTAGGTASRVYEIATPYAEADLADIHFVQSADVLTLVHSSYAPRELRRLGATNWQLSTISFVPDIATPAAPTIATGGPGGGTAVDYAYVVTAIADETLEESLPSVPGTTATIDLTVAGNYVNITPPVVVGAARFNVYRSTGGLYGFVGQTDTGPFRDQNVVADLTITPPLANNPFSGTDDYPRAVSYFEQRRAFGGTINKPQNVWLTRSGTEQNMGYSIPTQDDDSITLRIVAREAQQVRHLVPLNDLITPTSGGVWRISSSNSDVLTPASTSVRPQGYVGANNAQPVVTANSILYVADRGAHMREVTFSWESQSYKSDDVSVLAPHLFDYHDIVQLTYSTSPIPVAWGVRDDGVLLGMTYLPEQEVRAWHQHNTQGFFESVCSIAEWDEDGLYAIVQREINGVTTRYIERQASRNFTAPEDAFFVDAGATYRGAPAATVSGLWHLEGKTVRVLADAGVEGGPKVVTNGAITLDAPASVVHVGLGYDCDFRTMPVSFEMQGLGQGEPKNVNEIALRVYRSSNMLAGPTFDKLTTWPQRTPSVPYGSPPALFTGTASWKLSPQWQDDGSICVRQPDPLPLTILSMSLKVGSGG